MDAITNTTSNPRRQDRRFYAEPQAYISQDGEYLTLVLPGNLAVRKHVNFFKSVLGVPFIPKAKSRVQPQSSTLEMVAL